MNIRIKVAQMSMKINGKEDITTSANYDKLDQASTHPLEETSSTFSNHLLRSHFNFIIICVHEASEHHFPAKMRNLTVTSLPQITFSFI